MAYTIKAVHQSNNGVCDWHIHGMSNPFNTTYYMQAAILRYPVTDGQTAEPFGWIASMSAPASGSSTSVSWYNTMNDGKGAYGAVKAANGRWYSCGEAQLVYV